MWRLLCVFFILCSNSSFAQQIKGIVIPKDTLKITPNVLREVNIYGARNYKLDSINRRKEYANIFAQKPLTIMDVFTKRSPEPSKQYSAFQNSTSSIVGISLLPLVGLLTKNKSPNSKLQKQLLMEEETRFLDNRFSKEKVRALTSMKGDSLESFINIYRPGREVLLKMTDYEMLLYVKKSHKEFEKTFRKENMQPLIKK